MTREPGNLPRNSRLTQLFDGKSPGEALGLPNPIRGLGGFFVFLPPYSNSFRCRPPPRERGKEFSHGQVKSQKSKCKS